MGLFDFLGNVASSAIKVAVTPLAIVKDVVSLEPFEETDKLLSSAMDDLNDASDEIFDEN